MDYKRIPELKTVDLDLFRRRASEEVRITVAGLQILLHPLLHRLEKRKPRYLIDSRVSFVCLVGRTRFELVTNGLKVRFNGFSGTFLDRHHASKSLIFMY